LLPILKEIESRGLQSHIQGIAYSADFPTAIDIQSEIESVENKSPYLTPVGSINGMTYLFRSVIAKSPNYIGFESNLFAARPASRLLVPFISSIDQAKELEQSLKDSKHEQAALIFEAMAQSTDKEIVYPILYMAAQQWALAENDAKALQRLEQSIRGGWSYRGQILADPAFSKLAMNRDFQRIAKRCEEKPFDYLSSRGFDARTFYSPNTLGSRDPKFGVSYMLSMVLAVTRDLGLTKSEAESNLKRSVGADFTFPTGSFIFTKTGDVRTLTREPNFAMAIQALTARGMDARIIEQDIPPSGEKCSGVMMGTPDFSWAKSGAELLPGSIADNLTSLGGAMTIPNQTKATEYLRFGSAASSGAVTEPYSIQNKFPHPMIHVHYVDGLTAAEAFYSSVTCPYQLLIVGDPLCQPFCKPPRFEIGKTSDAIADQRPLRLSLKVDTSDKSSEPEILQLHLNGIMRNQAPFDNQLQINFNDSEPGSHEIRLVALAAKPLELRFEQSLWITLGTAKEQLSIDGPSDWKLSEEKPLKINLSQRNNPSEVRVLHDMELVGTIPPGESSLVLSPNQLGYGPVRLQAVQSIDGVRSIHSKPIVVRLEP